MNIHNNRPLYVQSLKSLFLFFQLCLSLSISVKFYLNCVVFRVLFCIKGIQSYFRPCNFHPLTLLKQQRFILNSHRYNCFYSEVICYNGIRPFLTSTADNQGGRGKNKTRIFLCKCAYTPRPTCIKLDVQYVSWLLLIDLLSCCMDYLDIISIK